jgi:hypothetical protein
MPICITLIKVMQRHWIILLFCNKQIGLVVTILFHLFHLCNSLWTHCQYNSQPNSHMHYFHQSNANAINYFVVCNIHAQNNIFHLIWFKIAITGLFWSYAIPSCLHYISYHLIEQCNTLRTHWQYHIWPIHTCITFIKMLQCPKDKTQISFPTIFTFTLPSSMFHNTLRPIEIISFYIVQQCNTLKTYWK